MKVFRFCKKYIIENISLFVIYIIINILSSLILIISPYLTGEFLDHLMIKKDLEFVYKIIIILGVLGICKLALGYVSSMIYTKVQTTMGYRLNKDVIKSVQDLSISFFNGIDKSYLSHIINVDSNNLIMFCLNTIQGIIINFLILFLSAFIMFKINKLILFVLLILILIYFLIYFLLKKPLYNINYKTKESQGTFFSKLFEQFNFIKLIKTQSIQKQMEKRLDSEFNDLLVNSIKLQKINYLFHGLNSILTIFSQSIIYLYGASLIFKNKLTIGFFTIFLSYFIMMFSSLNYFFNLSKEYQDILVSYNRLKKYFLKSKENINKEKINKIDYMKINNLSFSFDEKVIFKNLSLDFYKNNIYVIKGKNGSGKTTLLNLLIGLYDNEFEGEIFINNKDILNINKSHLRKYHIGFSEQEPELFQDTIKFNLSFNKVSINEKLIYEYAKYLNFSLFLKKLPDGLDTLILDKSSNISGGEKQKISILRCLIKDSDVLIFDEPSSALDLQTKKSFFKLINKIKKNKIIILVTHDDFCISKSDKVYALDNFI